MTIARNFFNYKFSLSPSYKCQKCRNALCYIKLLMWLLIKVSRRSVFTETESHVSCTRGDCALRWVYTSISYHCQTSHLATVVSTQYIFALLSFLRISILLYFNL